MVYDGRTKSLPVLLSAKDADAPLIVNSVQTDFTQFNAIGLLETLFNPSTVEIYKQNSYKICLIWC